MMLGLLAVWITNLVRTIGNLWRGILGRHVDYIHLDIRGQLPEFEPPSTWWQRRLFKMQAQASLQLLRRQFEWIALDPQVKGVVLTINSLTCGWATLQSLRDELHLLKDNRKRVIAYLMSFDLAEYYLACAADEILMPPAGFLNILGLRLEVQFLKDALAAIGLSVEVEAVSPYKAAGDMFTRADISLEHREQLERILTNRFDAIVDAISTARRKTPEEVRTLIDMAPLSPAAAVEHHLVDGACYEDELPHRLKQGEQPAVLLDWKQAQRALRRPMARYYRRMIGVVLIEGNIVQGSSRNLPFPIPLIGGRQSGSDTISQLLRQAERNRRVAALIVYVNSPGGDGFASDIIAHEMLRINKQKPILIAMGDVAASGGYYIAASSTAIIAQPGTLTGSIGVFTLRPVIGGLLERAHINTVVLSRGAHSGLYSFSHPSSESERKALRDVVFQHYAIFKEHVCRGRRLSEEQLEPVAGGRVWSGTEALQHGLIDQLGGVPAALLRAQELASLPLDRHAPLLLIRDYRQRQPPLPFPDSPADLLQELFWPRIWAALPFYERRSEES